MSDVTAPGTTGRCESCGRDDEQVDPVHRVYLDPETGEPLPHAEATEQWCASCQVTYPNLAARDS